MIEAPRILGLLAVSVGMLHAAEADEPVRLRELRGRHITLLTDLPSDTAVDQLPVVFDQAVPQWASYFDIDPQQLHDWHVRACLMRNEQRFRQHGLLPADLPPFLHGYQRGNEFWVREQPSAYYRRHLLLHEGTHALMEHALGGGGAAWYMEGIAELLATHRWQGGQLRLNVMPKSRNDVPFWGRIKLVREAVARDHGLSLPNVFALKGTQFRDVRAYAWSWAATVFLDRHPRFKDRMRQLKSRVTVPGDEFSAWFAQQLAVDSVELNEAWQLFLTELDYGYDVAADVITYQPIREITRTEQLAVRADRGWQSSGLRLRAGQPYRVQAQGRYQVRTDPEIWWSEAGGVTIRYHRGYPKGILLGALKPIEDRAAVSPLTKPRPLGGLSTLTPDTDAVLFLRINEPSGMRADNRGQLTIFIQPLSGPN